jgi:glutaredoxin
VWTVAWALLVAFAVVMLGGGVARARDPTVDLYIFHLNSCPHCQAARTFLAELSEEVPELVLHEYEVSSDPVAQHLFAEMTAELGGEPAAVPTIIVGDRMWVGFNDAIAAEIRSEVAARASGAADDAAAQAGGGGDERDSEWVEVPFVGDVDVGSSSLLVSTVVIAFVDGVNPCSLWVLSILLALVLHSGSRRRVVLVGTSFLLVTTALYGLYMVGAYSLLSYASFLSWIQRLVAAVVAVFAFVNLRDYFRSQPATLAIPASAKPGIYRRARALIAPDRSALAVAAGTAALAAGVSLIETPCSAALPLLWTDLLASHDASTAAAVTLFALYMAIFLADELALFGAVALTMRATRLQERHGRLLRLVTGSVMLGLAAVMLLDPTLLDDVSGTLALLAATVLVATVLAIVKRLVAGASSSFPRGRAQPREKRHRLVAARSHHHGTTP